MKLKWTATACALLGAGVLLSAQLHNGRADENAKGEIAKDKRMENTKSPTPAVLEFKMQSLGGDEVNLSRYAGKAILMVNTASKCGYTKQYAGLQKLHEEYSGKGLAILGFPANNFGHQEPGSNAEIGDFCKQNYGVNFDMFAKVSVVGADAAPLYQFLTSEKTDPKFAGPVKWNFEKFLIGRDGQILARFPSKIAPESDEVKTAIEAALAAK